MLALALFVLKLALLQTVSDFYETSFCASQPGHCGGER